MSLQANINGYIAITEDYEKNILMQISSLSMEIINERTSNTNLYKQAGNSIVVNVLVAILGQLFEGKEDVYKEILDKEKPYE
jgi:site-specific DNA-cytosine methylase